MSFQRHFQQQLQQHLLRVSLPRRNWASTGLGHTILAPPDSDPPIKKIAGPIVQLRRVPVNYQCGVYLQGSSPVVHPTKLEEPTASSLEACIREEVISQSTHRGRIIGLRSRSGELVTLADAATTGPMETFDVELEHMEFIHGSNAIEGSTLSSGETDWIIQTGLALTGHPVDEIKEVLNSMDAIDALKVTGSRADFTVEDVLRLHTILMYGLLPERISHYVGAFRWQNVRITGAIYSPPKAARIPELMEALATSVRTFEGDAVALAAVAHVDFVRVHPFMDGNGRLGRLLMNQFLLQAGYPLATIPGSMRMVYLDALSRADLVIEQDKPDPTAAFRRVLQEAVNESLDVYLDALRDESRSAPSKSAH